MIFAPISDSSRNTFANISLVLVGIMEGAALEKYENNNLYLHTFR